MAAAALGVRTILGLTATAPESITRSVSHVGAALFSLTYSLYCNILSIFSLLSQYSHYCNDFNNIKGYLESREMDEVVCELFYFVKREIYPGYFVCVDQQQ